MKKLEKVEWVIAEGNDVSDCGWDMLSRSSSLRELKVKIGAACKFQDEGLHSLSKINSSIPLERLIFEIGEGNETTDGGWGSFLGNIIPDKMLEMKLIVGKYNECGEKSLEKFAKTLETSTALEHFTLVFQGENKTDQTSFA